MVNDVSLWENSAKISFSNLPLKIKSIKVSKDFWIFVPSFALISKYSKLFFVAKFEAVSVEISLSSIKSNLLPSNNIFNSVLYSFTSLNFSGIIIIHRLILYLIKHFF